ncbi:hypothetical protein LJC18_00255 [Lachnospiraceae bacterium OttesenSCG-928-E19]|nr:hypothetical protein [Lachnospiraceae bacterium OttesenSCG-928-E19]
MSDKKETSYNIVFTLKQHNGADIKVNGRATLIPGEKPGEYTIDMPLVKLNDRDMGSIVDGRATRFETKHEPLKFAGAADYTPKKITKNTVKDNGNIFLCAPIDEMSNMGFSQFKTRLNKAIDNALNPPKNDSFLNFVFEKTHNFTAIMRIYINCPDTHVSERGIEIIKILKSASDKNVGFQTNIIGECSGWTALISQMGSNGWKNINQSGTITIAHDYTDDLRKSGININPENNISRVASNRGLVNRTLVAHEAFQHKLVSQIKEITY